MTPIYCTANGIGDAVMSACVAEGYRRSGRAASHLLGHPFRPMSEPEPIDDDRAVAVHVVLVLAILCIISTAVLAGYLLAQ